MIKMRHFAAILSLCAIGAIATLTTPAADAQPNGCTTECSVIGVTGFQPSTQSWVQVGNYALDGITLSNFDHMQTFPEEGLDGGGGGGEMFIVHTCRINYGAPIGSSPNGYTEAQIRNSYPGTSPVYPGSNGTTFMVSNGSFTGAPNGVIWESNGTGGYQGYARINGTDICTP